MAVSMATVRQVRSENPAAFVAKKPNRPALRPGKETVEETQRWPPT